MNGTDAALWPVIWQQEVPGVWKIVFDDGSGAQECDK